MESWEKLGVGSVPVLVTIYGISNYLWFSFRTGSSVFRSFYTGVLKYLLLGV